MLCLISSILEKDKTPFPMLPCIVGPYIFCLKSASNFRSPVMWLESPLSKYQINTWAIFLCLQIFLQKKKGLLWYPHLLGSLSVKPFWNSNHFDLKSISSWDLLGEFTTAPINTVTNFTTSITLKTTFPSYLN